MEFKRLSLIGNPYAGNKLNVILRVADIENLNISAINNNLACWNSIDRRTDDRLPAKKPLRKLDKIVINERRKSVVRIVAVCNLHLIRNDTNDLSPFYNEYQQHSSVNLHLEKIGLSYHTLGASASIGSAKLSDV